MNQFDKLLQTVDYGMSAEQVRAVKDKTKQERLDKELRDIYDLLNSTDDYYITVASLSSAAVLYLEDRGFKVTSRSVEEYGRESSTTYTISCKE